MQSINLGFASSDLSVSPHAKSVIKLNTIQPTLRSITDQIVLIEVCSISDVGTVGRVSVRRWPGWSIHLRIQ
jgi:hypothetical protein